MGTETWRDELEQAFARFDSDSNGEIDRKEFGELLDAMGSKMTEPDRDIGFALIDKDEDGFIDKDELAGWWEIVREEATSAS